MLDLTARYGDVKFGTQLIHPNLAETDWRVGGGFCPWSDEQRNTCVQGWSGTQGVSQLRCDIRKKLVGGMRTQSYHSVGKGHRVRTSVSTLTNIEYDTLAMMVVAQRCLRYVYTSWVLASGLLLGWKCVDFAYRPRFVLNSSLSPITHSIAHLLLNTPLLQIPKNTHTVIRSHQHTAQQPSWLLHYFVSRKGYAMS